MRTIDQWERLLRGTAAPISPGTANRAGATILDVMSIEWSARFVTRYDKSRDVGNALEAWHRLRAREERRRGDGHENG
jgi:hypothetical protein